jgi:ABC-type sugar transport system ATPase subunit
MAAISVESLTRRFAEHPFAGICDVSLQIPDGEIHTVVGASGSGKTTLLRLIAGLDTPDSGVVRIGGRDVTCLIPAERDVGLLPQRPALYPHLSIWSNLSIGLELRRPRVSSSEVRRRVDEAIGRLGLESLMDRRPFQLSGGEQQRIALGRILVRRPAVWLLDEPFNHLDAARKVRFRRDLLLLTAQLPATILFVTHDPDEASALGQRLVVLHEGRVAQVGRPGDVFARPAHRTVAELLGTPAVNLVDGALSLEGENLLFAAADGAIRLPIPAELATRATVGRPVTLGIRPDAIRPALPTSPRDDNLVRVGGWRVQTVERLFPRCLVTATLGKWAWSFWWEGEAPQMGAEVALDIELARGVWI